MTRSSTLVACLALATAASFASAQTPAPATPAATATPAPTAAATPAAPVGDAKRGQELVFTCYGCHGIEGYRNAYPNFRVPRIGGQSRQYLVNALQAYKDGTRKHPTMQAQAQSFSDQDIADIAAFLSTAK